MLFYLVCFVDKPAYVVMVTAWPYIESSIILLLQNQFAMHVYIAVPCCMLLPWIYLLLSTCILLSQSLLPYCTKSIHIHCLLYVVSCLHRMYVVDMIAISLDDDVYVESRPDLAIGCHLISWVACTFLLSLLVFWLIYIDSMCVDTLNNPLVVKHVNFIPKGQTCIDDQL